MANTVITSTLLAEERQHIVDIASYAMYKIGNTWYRAEIDNAAIQTNGAVHISFYVHKVGDGSTPASEFRILRADGQILVSRAENVAFVSHMDTIYYRFKIGVSVNETPET